MTATPGMLTVGVTEKVYLDYQKGWLGLQVEPEDPNRAETIRNCIPAEDRKYLSYKRTWIVKPKWGPTIAGIIEQFCQGYTIYIAPGQNDMIRGLLYGAQPISDDRAMISGVGEVEVFGVVGVGGVRPTPAPEEPANKPQVVDQVRAVQVAMAHTPAATTIRFDAAQSLLNQRYQSVLWQWNSNDKIREACHTIGMKARDWADREVDRLGQLPENSAVATTNGLARKAARDIAWAEAIRARSGVEI